MFENEWHFQIESDTEDNAERFRKTTHSNTDDEVTCRRDKAQMEIMQQLS